MDFVICIFEVCILYDFFNGIFEKRSESKWVIWAVLAGSAIATYAVNCFQRTDVNIYMVAIIMLSTIFILFRGKWKKVLSYGLLFWITLCSSEFVLGIFFIYISGGNFPENAVDSDQGFFMIISAKLLAYVTCRFIKKFINKTETQISGTLIKMELLLPITACFIYYGVVYTDTQDKRGRVSLIIGCILLMVCNMVVFYVLEKLTSVMNQNKEYELMEMQNELHSVYCNKMEEISLKQRKYAHDLKDYLQTIGGLAAKSQNQEILGILKDMEVEIDSISDKVYTQNSILNALLCEREMFAQKNQVELKIAVEPDLELETFARGDLIVMVGNLLDNAIEAAAQCQEEKLVELNFFQSEGNFIVLNIENTYINEIKKTGKE